MPKEYKNERWADWKFEMDQFELKEYLKMKGTVKKETVEEIPTKNRKQTGFWWILNHVFFSLFLVFIISINQNVNIENLKNLSIIWQINCKIN